MSCAEVCCVNLHLCTNMGNKSIETDKLNLGRGYVLTIHIIHCLHVCYIYVSIIKNVVRCPLSIVHCPTDRLSRMQIAVVFSFDK